MTGESGGGTARPEERLARLQWVTSQLGGALDVESVADVIFSAGLDVLGTATALLALVVEGGARLQVVRQVGLPPRELESLSRAFRALSAEGDAAPGWPFLALDSRTPLCDSVRHLEAVFLDAGNPFHARYPPLVSEVLAEHGHAALACLPLSIPGPNGSRVAIGGLRLAFPTARRFEPEDRAFMGALADQCALALHRARLFDEARAAARAAAEATRTRDQFLAAISHELRAPTAAMLLWEKLLRDDPDNPEARVRALDAIHESLMAQSRMVDDLLDVARGIRGVLRVDHRPVAIERVVRAAVERIVPSASARGVEVTLERELSDPPGAALVLGDEVRLGQVLANLLSNAVKYSDRGGRMTVVTRRRGEEIEVEVRDRGQGFSPERLGGLFEPFQPAQGPAGEGEHASGLGLGLAIARQIVQLHGGTLEGRSPGPGRGATFVVALPALGEAEAQRGRGGPQAPHPAALVGLRALVVDDDPYVREALTRVLRRAGATVESVASGAAARALLDAGPRPDVLLCDVVMPREDGPTFLRRLRERDREQDRQDAAPQQAGAPSPVRPMKAIALTALTSPESRDEALGAGFDEYLIKPIEPDALVAAVAAVAATLAATIGREAAPEPGAGDPAGPQTVPRRSNT